MENHALRLKELGRRDGFRLSIEPYDMTPLADMTLGTAADVPMSEFWLYGFHTAHSVFEAAGIAHTGGKKVMAAEAFTSDDREAWQAHPASMKPLGDWAFTAGVNRIVFHRYQNQAGIMTRPGMTMGPYGVHWERTQTWWDMVPAYHAYLSRAQFLLRQGLPVADVCFLVAEGAPHAFRAPESALRGDPPMPVGPAFDGCPPETLLASARVEAGRVFFPDGMSYRVLVLPERETMTPALLKKVGDLVAAGATVVGPRPRKSPSLWVTRNAMPRSRGWLPRSGATATAKRSRSTFSALDASSGFAGRSVLRSPPRPVKKPGTSVPRPSMNPSSMAISRSLRTSSKEWRSSLISVLMCPCAGRIGGTGRRRSTSSPIPQGRMVDMPALFRVSGKRPELWDPITGTTRGLTGSAEKDGRISVALRLEPFQSFFIVFRDAAPPVSDADPAPLPASAARPDFPVPEEIASLEGPWEVAFDPKGGGPERSQPSRRSTTGAAGPRTGSSIIQERPSTGRPSTCLRPLSWKAGVFGSTWGRSRTSPAVRLNGRDLGIVWCDPWRVEITGAIKPKGNRLEVHVVNLWPNRLIGDEREPPDAEYARGGDLARWPDWLLEGKPRPSAGRLTFSTWKHYEKDSPLLPSGLLGPIRVLLTRD